MMEGRLSIASASAVALFSAAVGAVTAVHIYRSWGLQRCKLEETNGKEEEGEGVPPVSPTEGVLGAIGNTPLIEIRSLSKATGCRILGKAEFLNPGGSVKDRVALQICKEALESGQLQPGGLITEGSAGSTGVSLAMVASALGCRCFVALPDDAAIEKVQLLEALGAEVERVRPVSITHRDHFVNVARRRAEGKQKSNLRASDKGKAASQGGGAMEDARTIPSESGVANDEPSGSGFFADQFESLANFRSHYHGTAPEIWRQCHGHIDAFVAAAGTGGTIAGVSRFLKEKKESVRCYLVDPPGSSLYNKVTRGVLYTKEEAEGRRLKNPFDTITEGIGINRLTANFALASLDGAFRATDREAVEMSRYLLREDGLFIGSSSAVNCVGAVRVARLLGPGHTIVTILCDGGSRHLSKFHNPDYLRTHSLIPEAHGLEFLA